MLSEKEKLEQELKLLEESLTLDVITREEFENAKARIEAKLSTLETKPEAKFEKIGEVKEEAKPKEKKKKEKPKAEEEGPIIKYEDIKKEEPVKEEPKPEAYKEEALKEEEKEELKEEDIAELEKEAEVEKEEIQKKLEEEKSLEEELIEKVTVEEKPVEEGKPKIEIYEEGKGIKKSTIVYTILIIIIALGIWYVFFLDKSGVEEIFVDEGLSLIACNSDEDCTEEGKIGVCKNPGESNAECEYIEDVNIKLIVLNSNECFNCDTSRVLSILKTFYPNLDIEDIDFDTEEGKEIIENFNINALPAYIFNSSFKESYNYAKLSSSFNEVNGDFVMKNSVANANYYLNSEEMPNKLDLFVIEGQSASTKAEENLQEFLDVFGDKVIFEKSDENSAVAKELGINSFPAFLINNKIKFSGVQSADKIKENFCEMNKLDECSLELSKSLV